MPETPNPDDTDDLTALREQTTHGDRLDEAANNEVSSEFIDTLVSELDAIDAGETQKTVSVWDGSFTAFLHALEAHPEQLDAVGADLQAHLTYQLMTPSIAARSSDSHSVSDSKKLHRRPL